MRGYEALIPGVHNTLDLHDQETLSPVVSELLLSPQINSSPSKVRVPLPTRQSLKQGPPTKTTGLSQGYVIGQPFRHGSTEVTTSSMPLLFTVSDSSSEMSDVSTTTGEDVQYPISPVPLPRISPPTSQLAKLRTTDVDMSSPSSSPTPRHTYVNLPTTGEDPEVHFLLNLLRIRLSDILERNKNNEPRTVHIVESASVSSYDPFANPDNIYAEEPDSNIVQPQPQKASSLPPITTVTPADHSEESLTLSSPTQQSSVLLSTPSSPTTPPVHLLHATTGWNWTHPNTTGGPVSDPVLYSTGHPPQEPGWPKIVPLDDAGEYSRAYVEEVSSPVHMWRQQQWRAQVSRMVNTLFPNLEHLAASGKGARMNPVHLVRIRDEIPEPLFRQVFPQYGGYKDLELDLSERRPNGNRRPNRWLSYISRIRRTRSQFQELFAAAENLVKAHTDYPAGLQSYVCKQDVTAFIAEHETSSILRTSGSRFLCAFLHFLNHHEYHVLARNIHTFLHLRFDASAELWSLIHLVIDRLDPSSGHYDLDFDQVEAPECSPFATDSAWVYFY